MMRQYGDETLQLSHSTRHPENLHKYIIITPESGKGSAAIFYLCAGVWHSILKLGVEKHLMLQKSIQKCLKKININIYSGSQLI